MFFRYFESSVIIVELFGLMTTPLKIIVSVSCPTLLSHTFVTCFISYLPLLFLTSFLLSFLLFLLSFIPFSHFPNLLHFFYPLFPISLAVRISFFFLNSLNLLYLFILQGELFTQMVHSSPVLTPCMFEYVYFARPDSVRRVHITYTQISHL